MCYPQTMILKKKKNMTKLILPTNAIHFEWDYYSEDKVTVVALDNSLDYFKAHPMMIHGKLYDVFNERLTKDCKCIDGCIYFYAGKDDEVWKMNDLIEKFQNMRKDMISKKTWKPTGKATINNNSIISKL